MSHKKYYEPNFSSIICRSATFPLNSSLFDTEEGHWAHPLELFCQHSLQNIYQLLVSQLLKQLDKAPAFYYFSVLWHKPNVPGTQEGNVIQEHLYILL